ncbi:MAG: PilZ domain-containing protein [SAR324 cluster bacterium]|nr:PilZ domain-containing protein [SAR324 cluster bacterium]
MRKRIHTNLTRVKVILSGLIWFCCTAQVGSKRVDPNINLEAFKFDSGVPIAIPPSFFVFLIFVIAGIIAVFVLVNRLTKQRYEQKIEKITDDKANLRLEVTLNTRRIEENAQSFINEIAQKVLGASESKDILPLVESNEFFEKTVAEFKGAEPTPDILKKIFLLRQELGFEFSNKSVPFICTQMLSTAAKLECHLPHPSRQVIFMTPILDINESRFMIKPPTVKGQPANLKKFKQLHFRIRRDGDAEYELIAPVINQVGGKINAVVMGHTTRIKKMFIRESERIPTNIAATFYHFTETPGEPQNLEHFENPEVSFEAMIKDMSLGGLKLDAKTIPESLRNDDLLVFHLKGANLREGIMVRVISVGTNEQEGYTLHLQYNQMRDLTRMKVNKFLYRMKKQNALRQQRRTQQKQPVEPSQSPNLSTPTLPPSSFESMMPSAFAQTKPSEQATATETASDRFKRTLKLQTDASNSAKASAPRKEGGQVPKKDKPVTRDERNALLGP